jgi:hypothetical protein
MQTPMLGTWNVTVHSLRPFTIHGDIYYEVHLTRDESPDEMLALRIPQHAITDPTAGDRLAITFLMGQVTQTTKL